MTETPTKVRHTGTFVWESSFHRSQVEGLRGGAPDAETIHRHQMASAFAREMLAALGDGRRYVVTVTTETQRGWPPGADVISVRTRALVLLADPEDADVGEQVVHGPKFGIEPVGTVVYVPLSSRGTERSGTLGIFGRAVEGSASPDVWTRHD